MLWSFKTISECELFRVYEGRANRDDIFTTIIHGEITNNPELISLGSYSTCVRGSYSCQPPPSHLPFVLNTPGNPGPWSNIHLAPPGVWHITALEDNTLYVCLMPIIDQTIDYVEYRGENTIDLDVETWAVPLGGPATINGIVIPEFHIAHKETGIMKITNSVLVVCLTER